jgi:outer membrane lipoprotein-sorting protein
VEVNGVTVPTKLSIFNAENQLAGEVLYKNVQINKGLADELFKI